LHGRQQHLAHNGLRSPVQLPRSIPRHLYGGFLLVLLVLLLLVLVLAVFQRFLQQALPVLFPFALQRLPTLLFLQQPVGLILRLGQVGRRL
jgi:hypothetical protein